MAGAVDGLGGSLLAGFGMAATRARSWIHMMIFAAALTVTLYVIMDIHAGARASG